MRARQITPTSGSSFGGGTVGSVLFVGSGPVISENNSAFFWDNTNNALTIGILDVSGNPSTILLHGAGWDNLFLGHIAGNYTLTAGAGTIGNVGIGHESCNGLTTGAKNTGIGSGTLWFLQSGSNNFAGGYKALRSGTAYSNCVAIGSLALEINTGNNNTACGFQALGNNGAGISNCGIGLQTLLNNLTHSRSTGCGNGSLFNSDADDNTALGYLSGQTITSGTQCLFLGASSDASANNLNNAIAIGYGASVDASNCMVLGNGSLTVVKPGTNGACDLGASAKKWATVYCSTVSAATVSASSQITTPAGSTGTPSILLNTTAGIYSSGTSAIDFAIGGSDAVRFNTSQILASGYDLGSAAVPMANLFLGASGQIQFGNPVDAVFIRDGATGAVAQKAGNTAQEYRVYAGNGSYLSTPKCVNESLTIAAAATTDSSTTIPAGAIIMAVAVRVTTVIPTAATFTVTTATGGTTMNTAAVSTAANTTDKGTAGGGFYQSAATKVRITPNATPATATGVVRLAIYYIDATAPTS